MRDIDNQKYLREEQYKDASNFSARVALHVNYGIGARSWQHWVFDYLAVMPEDAKILELGCGPGRLWSENMDRIPAGWQITLSDFSTGMLDEARKNLAGASRIFEFAEVDTQQIPFEDESFDAVIANHMLYHVPDRPKAFAEIARVLKPGGRLFAATNGADHMKELLALLPAVGIWHAGMEYHSGFNLQNGAEQLAPFFRDVQLHLIDDGLRVTDADALIAYIASFTPAEEMTSDRVAAIAGLVNREIAEQGAFAVKKESGLFEARKA